MTDIHYTFSINMGFSNSEFIKVYFDYAIINWTTLQKVPFCRHEFQSTKG